MKTIQVDILNDKALKLLQDLEGLKLIRLRSDSTQSTPLQWAAHKGRMKKQAIHEIDKQLQNLRSDWE
jgi:hypothetical protein